MKYEILQNGNLKISVELDEEFNTDGDFFSCFEPVLTNGLSEVLPEMIGALTDSPIVSDECPDYEEEVLNSDDCNVWWYPEYETTCFIEQLENQGYIIMTKVGS